MTTGTSGHPMPQGRAKHLDQVRAPQVAQQRSRWSRGVRVASIGAAVAVTAVAGGLVLGSGQQANATTMANVQTGSVVAGGFGADSSPTPTMAADMPGMDMSGSNPTPTMADDMSGMDMSGSTPTPTMAADMPGMDMSGSTPTPTPTGAMSGDMPGMDMPGSGHDHGSSPAAVSNRPLAPVLGTFGGGASAVMLTAGLLRRKDRAAGAVKVAARAARKAGK